MMLLVWLLWHCMVVSAFGVAGMVRLGRALASREHAKATQEAQLRRVYSEEPGAEGGRKLGELMAATAMFYGAWLALHALVAK